MNNNNNNSSIESQSIIGVKRENGGQGEEPELKKGKTEPPSPFQVQPNPKPTLPPSSNSNMRPSPVSNISNISQSGASSSVPLSVVTTTNSTTNVPVLNLPTHCSWFKSTEIHETEKNALPEFFNESSPSKTPSIYKEYRDFMIYAYQQNPSQYLTQTACRRNLAGDICSILRVHTFLEYWGLINHNISPDLSTPMALQAALNQQSKPKSQPIEQLSQLSQDSSNSSNAKDNLKGNSLATHQTIFPIPSAPQFRCSICKVDCYRTRYTSNLGAINNAIHGLMGQERKQETILCPNCFSQGKYPENMTSQDFSRQDAPSDISSAPYPNEWTDQEILLLLEALEKHPDDWDFVASYVGTKNKEQCLLQFIRLPIEDPFLERQLANPHPPYKFVDSNLNPVEGDSLESKLFTEDSTSFNLSSNPVLAMVAFIASSVSPTVASAAAKAASEVFDRKKEQAISEIPEESIKEAAATAVAAATIKAKVRRKND
eukprot:TRINITY_DN3367_c0_g2_i5.p1 TRINITY_DN3367_c0_g2~~TRINITY_DN3367_c0_g2_i5.p1  ORF type:complete len:487 (+),score=129.53 TRINITY_DN3367_c0_g2_i5:186-1646(+)